MEDKQSRLLMMLAALLLLVVGVLTLADPPEEHAEGEPEWTRVVPQDIDPSTVRTLSIQRSDDVPVRLLRQDSGWAINDPVQARADSRVVDNIVDAILELEASPPLEGVAPADFGLVPPAAVVQVAIGTEQNLTLHLGEDSPVGSSTYLQVDGASDVRRSKRRLAATVVRSLDELRARELVLFSRSQVQSVSLVGPGGQVRFVHDIHGWWMDGDVRHRADSAEIDAMLDGVLALRAERFGEGPLARPDPLVTLIARTADDTHEVTVGALDGELRLLTGSAQPGPVLARTTGIDDSVVRTKAGWLATELIPVRHYTVDAIDIKLGESTFSATRADQRWSDPAAELWLSALDKTTAERGLELPPPDAAWGHVQLGEGDTRTERISLHQSLEDGSRVATDSSGGAPFRVTGEQMRALAEALAAAGTPTDAP